jgi:hypothetical protein
MTVAGVFGLPHLSEDAVAAFADGVLSASAADRAGRHCAECAECAEAVRAQREAALLLRTASNPSMSADLLSRLASVPMSAPLPPPRGGLPTVLGADGKPMFVAHDSRNADRLAQLGPDGAPTSRPTEHQAAQHQPTQNPAGPPPSHGHRRVLLPVGILASAAAVVAAGAIGSQLTSVPRPAEQQPASVHQLSSTLTGSVQRSATPSRSRPARGLVSLSSQTLVNRTGQPVARQTGTGQLTTGQLGRVVVSPRPPLIRPVGAVPAASTARPGSR